jgi:hypothetical protein
MQHGASFHAVTTCHPSNANAKQITPLRFHPAANKWITNILVDVQYKATFRQHSFPSLSPISPRLHPTFIFCIFASIPKDGPTSQGGENIWDLLPYPVCLLFLAVTFPRAGSWINHIAFPSPTTLRLHFTSCHPSPLTTPTSVSVADVPWYVTQCSYGEVPGKSDVLAAETMRSRVYCFLRSQAAHSDWNLQVSEERTASIVKVEPDCRGWSPQNNNHIFPNFFYSTRIVFFLNFFFFYNYDVLSSYFGPRCCVVV